MTKPFRTVAVLVMTSTLAGCSLATGIRTNTEAIGRSTDQVGRNTTAVEASTKF